MTGRSRRARKPPRPRRGNVLETRRGNGLEVRRRRRSTMLMTAATIIAFGLLAFAVTGFMMHTARTGAQAERSTGVMLAAPETYQTWPSPQELAPIAARDDDERPLTEKEIFAERSIRHQGTRLRLKRSALEADCRLAVHGRALEMELGKAGCTQVARGLYVTKDRRLAAQFTLFNLEDAEAATGLVTGLEASYRGEWMAPLDPRMPSGYSEGSGYALGHYAAVLWSGRADGASPGPEDDLISLTLAARAAEKAVFARAVRAGEG